MIVLYASVIGTIAMFAGGFAIRMAISRCVSTQRLKLREEFEVKQCRNDSDESKALLLPIRSGVHAV